MKNKELNQNELIVLRYLKIKYKECDNLQYLLWEFLNSVYEEPAMQIELSPHVDAWHKLTEMSKFNVLAQISEWGFLNQQQ